MPYRLMIDYLKLKDITSVFLGKPFKTKADKNPEHGNAYLVQISELNSGFLNNHENLSKIHANESDVQFFLEKNDILMPLRGGRVFVDLFLQNLNLPVIANNQIAVIRPNCRVCNVEYIYWYLNSKEIQRYFELSSQGSGISSLTKRIVEDVPVKIPSIDIQRKIGLIYRNWMEQRRQYMELIISGDLAYGALCEQLLIQQDM